MSGHFHEKLDKAPVMFLNLWPSSSYVQLIVQAENLRVQNFVTPGLVTEIMKISNQ